jgi:hypothetical protein
METGRDASLFRGGHWESQVMHADLSRAAGRSLRRLQRGGRRLGLLAVYGTQIAWGKEKHYFAEPAQSPSVFSMRYWVRLSSDGNGHRIMVECRPLFVAC